MIPIDVLRVFHRIVIPHFPVIALKQQDWTDRATMDSGSVLFHVATRKNHKARRSHKDLIRRV
jgi:hypothetical protein